MSDLLPLPDEIYPRVVTNDAPSKGYYVAMGLVLSVWVITPASCVYLLWYGLYGRELVNRAGLTAVIFAGYALTETVFAIYHHYLIRHVQTPSPTSDLSLELRNSLFLKVLQAGLFYPTPTISAEPTADERLYRSGHITAAELHHRRDGDYETSVGMQSRARVGKLDDGDIAVIQAFAGGEAEREKRLTDEIEDDVGIREGASWNPDGITDREGNIKALHFWDRRAVDFRERMRTWFNHAEWSRIKKKNMMIWIAWSCFNLPLEDAQANPKWAKFLDETMDLLEARTGGKFPEGYDPEISVARLTMDPVNAKGRPLILYALTNAINWWLREIVYPAHGMSFYTQDGIDYLIRIPKGWTAERGKTHPNAMPVIYLHGLGFGLVSFAQTCESALRLMSIPIPAPKLLPRQTPLEVSADPSARDPHGAPHLAGVLQRPASPSVDADADGQSDEEYLSQVGVLGRASNRGRRGARRGVAAESFERKCCAWLDYEGLPEPRAKEHVCRPGGVLSMGGSTPSDVCHAFCYRIPKTAMELLLYYFIASEVGIANYIQRNFDWADNTLFFDEIPNATDPTKTAFFLGGRDFIVDAPRVRRYLERHGVTSGIHWDANGGHGDGLAGEARDRVVQFCGTGSTDGWEGWLSGGVRRHVREKRHWDSTESTEIGEDSDSTTVGGTREKVD
ncbi:hypothetical protein P7C73_g4139, partial [Tremellales sp. Uapishka_1]